MWAQPAFDVVTVMRNLVVQGRYVVFASVVSFGGSPFSLICTVSLLACI